MEVDRGTVVVAAASSEKGPAVRDETDCVGEKEKYLERKKSNPRLRWISTDFLSRISFFFFQPPSFLHK